MFLRLEHTTPQLATAAKPVQARITWHAKPQQATVRGLNQLWPGFQSALTSTRIALAAQQPGAFTDEVTEDEAIVVRDGSVLLPNGKRVYAASSVNDESWCSHVIVDEQDFNPNAGIIIYARVEQLFEFRGVPLSLCRFLHPQGNYDTDGTKPDLPDVVWCDFATGLALPPRNSIWNEDELYHQWDILPIASLREPVLLLPAPVANVTHSLTNPRATSYWLHAHWADGILPELSADHPQLSKRLLQRLEHLASSPEGAPAPVNPPPSGASGLEGEGQEDDNDSDADEDFLIARE